jgi:diacylglycerol kinase family enzyme
MGGWLLVNPRSGPDSGLGELLAAAGARGLETHILREDEDAAALAREAQADVLGVSGGDGSLAAVAEAAIARDLPFVCVPFGTRNHFARDLGLDRDDAVGALAAFDGTEQRVDVGRANERLFLNNVSIGAYAVLVHHGWRRALDSLRFRQRLTVDGEPVHTRLLLIGNNAYSLTGSRECLDEGLLHLYTPGLELTAAKRAVVGAHGKRVRTAIDGEGVVLTMPIEFTIEPAALRVLVPPGPVAQ